MDIKESQKQIDDIFSRNVSEFIDPNGLFKEKLLKKTQGKYKKDIIIKFGIDPTRPDIHLGHAAVFRKLRQFQDLGCKVVFLIGDYTAQIGDPTGKSKIRPELEQREVEKNMKTYLDQVGAILKTEKEVFSWIRNSDWFTGVTDIKPKKGVVIRIMDKVLNAGTLVGKAVLYNQTRMQKTHLGKNVIHTVTLTRMLSILKKITHQRLIERDMFQERIKKGEELYMHEMMYPVLQGTDSSVLAQIYGSCDLEIGATDQTFNILIGRDIMKANKQDQQSVLLINLLEGTDGKEKMSKSLDNYIAITDPPNDMYGKLMSIPDSSLINYFELCTYTSVDDIKKIEKDIREEKVNPRDIKMRLARQITSIYHGEKSAEEAEQSFVKTFQKGGTPEDIQEVSVSKGVELGDVLVKEGVISSKSEFRRLIESGAISNIETKEKIKDPKYIIKDPITLKVGKHRFIKIII